jgi:hypothetical protein
MARAVRMLSGEKITLPGRCRKSPYMARPKLLSSWVKDVKCREGATCLGSVSEGRPCSTVNNLRSHPLRFPVNESLRSAQGVRLEIRVGDRT